MAKYSVNTAFNAINNMSAPIRQMQNSIRQFTQAINLSDKELKKLGKDNQLTKLQVQLRNAKGLMKDFGNATLAVGKHIASIGVKTVGVGLVAGAAGVIKGVHDGVVSVGQKRDDINSYGVIFGKDKAKEEYNKSRDIGQKTQFSTQEVIEGRRVLKLSGLPTDEKSMMGLANIAAVMKKSFEDIYMAYQDAATGQYTRLKDNMGMDVSTKDGTPVSVKYGGETIALKNGMKDLVALIKSVGEIKYAGAAAKQMDNLAGKEASLADAYNNMTTDVADNSGAYDLALEMISDLANTIPGETEDATASLKELVTLARDNKKEIYGLIGDTFKGLKEGLQFISDNKNGFIAFGEIFGGGLATSLELLMLPLRAIKWAIDEINKLHLGTTLYDGVHELGNKLSHPIDTLFGGHDPTTDHPSYEQAQVLKEKAKTIGENTNGQPVVNLAVTNTSDTPITTSTQVTSPSGAKPKVNTGNNSARSMGRNGAPFLPH